jgi:hypothetical protein
MLTLFVFPFIPAQGANEKIYEEIEWIQLMPEDDLEALLNPPDFLADIQDGSELDSVDALSNMTTDNEIALRFEQALTSTRVIDSFSQKSVRIPGFMVPLTSDEQQRVTEFFIVPYFGACLHMPPPPPNQIIFGKVKQGFELSKLDMPFWFEGRINIETISNTTGTAAYGMILDNIREYE